MQRAWDIELIFPIKDAASAALMVIKADCLHNAGVISDGEKQWVYSRARPFLAEDAQRRRLIALTPKQAPRRPGPSRNWTPALTTNSQTLASGRPIKLLNRACQGCHRAS